MAFRSLFYLGLVLAGLTQAAPVRDTDIKQGITTIATPTTAASPTQCTGQAFTAVPIPSHIPSGSIYLVNGAFISSHLLFDISYYGVTVDMKSNICVAQCLEGRDFDNGNDGGTINGKYCESAFTSHTGNEVLCQLFDAPLYETDWVIVGSGSNQTVDLGIGENRSCA